MLRAIVLRASYHRLSIRFVRLPRVVALVGHRRRFRIDVAENSALNAIVVFGHRSPSHRFHFKRSARSRSAVRLGVGVRWNPSVGIGRSVGCARVRELDHRPQHLGHAPRLRDAAARRIRRFRIEDLADRSDARIVEVLDESRQHLLRPVDVVRIHLQPRVDEWTDQPGPHRALVIRRVATPEIAEVLRFEFGIAWCQRPESYRRQQPLADHIHHRLPMRLIEDRVVQRNGEHLVGTAFRIDAAGPALFRVDYVVQVTAARIPEAIVEGAPRLLRPLAILRRITTQSSTFASIHVSWYPAAPWQSRPSRWSTWIPKRVPRTCASTMRWSV